MRLDKFLSECVIDSRSELKKNIKKGKVTVNGESIKKPEYHIDETRDIVCYLGKEYQYEPFVYYMLNKPQGVVSATKDNTCQTVIDLLKDENRKDLFPVGRLDKDTEGLLLITNDGALAHSLLSPKKHVSKTYFAKIIGLVGEAQVSCFQEGMEIGESKLTLPAKLEIIGWENMNKSKLTKVEDKIIDDTTLNQTSLTDDKSNCIEDKINVETNIITDIDTTIITDVKITITEGKFHQVKRMFHAAGMEVAYLQRISMGNLYLDEALPLGSYKKISLTEVLEGELS